MTKFFLRVQKVRQSIVSRGIGPDHRFVGCEPIDRLQPPGCVRSINEMDIQALKSLIQGGIHRIDAGISSLKDGTEMFPIVAACAATGGLYLLLKPSQTQASSDTTIINIKKQEGIAVTSIKDLLQYDIGGPLCNFVTRWMITPSVTSVVVTNYGSRIPKFPKGVCNLTQCVRINVSGNGIESIPEEIGALTKLEYLDISSNNLCSLPESMSKLVSLKTLNAMNNKIEYIPESFGWLRSLEILGLKGNRLKALPLGIQNLTLLKELYLTDNNLKALPETIHGCCNLVKLQASHNDLQSLPESIGNLKKLELLRVACCELESIPASIANAQSLSWFSMAGNPVAKSPSKKSGIPRLQMDDLSIGQKLGDGASGEVFMAQHKNKTVALKIFRQEKSPDGYCEDEVNLACMVNDINLARVLGKIDEPLGIIMEYVEGKPLAEKPNSTSLLRCRWNENDRFSIGFVLRCIACVAGALEHLHSKSIAHGDVYAHNVLAAQDGTSILCDYGASFIYKKGEPSHASFEAQEVRAFGLLVRDLVERIDIEFENMEVALDCQKQLLMIIQQCLSSNPSKRPLFSVLARKLRSLEKSAASSGTPRSDSRFFIRQKRQEDRSGRETAR